MEKIYDGYHGFKKVEITNELRRTHVEEYESLIVYREKLTSIHKKYPNLFGGK